MRYGWIVAVLLAVAVVAAGTWIVLPHSARFTIVNAGEGTIYKIDKATGQTWLVTNSREIAVTDPRPPAQSGLSPEQEAIELARKAGGDLLGGASYTTTESLIRERFEHGEIKSQQILGWSATAVDEQNYVVWFRWVTNENWERGYRFYANLPGGIVQRAPLAYTFEEVKEMERRAEERDQKRLAPGSPGKALTP